MYPSQNHHQNNQTQNNQNNQQLQIQTQNTKMPRGNKDNKPRGRMTAYAFFVQTCREEHKKKHPEETVIFAEFSKKCAERWKVSASFICQNFNFFFWKIINFYLLLLLRS